MSKYAFIHAPVLVVLAVMLVAGDAYAQMNRPTSTPPLRPAGMGENPNALRGIGTLLEACESENSASSSPRCARLAEVKENFEARQEMLKQKQEEIRARMAERRAAFSEQVQNRIKQFAQNAITRLERTLERLTEIAHRLEERAEALKERGADMSAVEETLAEALDTIEEASAALSGIDIDVDYAATSENPKEDWVEARAQFQQIHELIKKIHTLLREAVAEMKTAVADMEGARGVRDAVSHGTTTNNSPE